VFGHFIDWSANDRQVDRFESPLPISLGMVDDSHRYSFGKPPVGSPDADYLLSKTPRFECFGNRSPQQANSDYGDLVVGVHPDLFS
jgi:hypothetical protein